MTGSDVGCETSRLKSCILRFSIGDAEMPPRRDTPERIAVRRHGDQDSLVRSFALCIELRVITTYAH